MVVPTRIGWWSLAVLATGALGVVLFVGVGGRFLEPAPSRPAPGAVLADPGCRLVVGEGMGRDIALVFVPVAGGAWFAVVDHRGVAFDGTLPFVPGELGFGMRADGTVLAGFGGDGKLRVVRDGQTVFELDGYRYFGIAGDGSSFFAVETLAGAASRLVVHGLDSRQPHHVDLGTALTDGPMWYGVSYSGDFDEIAILPLHGNPNEINRFFPVGGGPLREVVVKRRPSMLPKDIAVFASSEVSYHARNRGTDEHDSLGWYWVISKVRRDFDNGTEREEENWSRELRFLGPLNVHLSDDGAWLAVNDLFWGVLLIDTADGRIVFSDPPRTADFSPNMFSTRGRDGPADLYSARFFDGFLHVIRWSQVANEGVVKVFELDTGGNGFRQIDRVEIKKAPGESDEDYARRTESEPENTVTCTAAALLHGRLLVRDGGLAYEPTRREP